jgi:hypothetical protein
MQKNEPIIFWYCNHRGDEGYRNVTPLGIRFGSSDYYPERQWLLRGFDNDKGAEREFAMARMTNFVGHDEFDITLLDRGGRARLAVSELDGLHGVLFGAAPPLQAPALIASIRVRIKKIDDLLHPLAPKEPNADEAHGEIHDLAYEFEQVVSGLQAPAHSDAVREAFEEWAARDSRDLTPLQLEERVEDNGLYYESSSTNDAYIGWREASKHTALTAPAAKAPAVSSDAVREMREALTPSAETKAAYHGEFKFSVTVRDIDHDGDEFESHRDVLVPWTTIKEIMAAIAARAARALPSHGGEKADTPICARCGKPAVGKCEKAGEPDAAAASRDASGSYSGTGSAY